MGKIVLDFTGVADGFSPVPNGTYNARVKEVKEGVSDAGNNTFNFTFVITGPTQKGRQVWLNTNDGTDAKWKLKATLKGFGYTNDQLSGKVAMDFQELVEAECSIVVKNRQGKGQYADKIYSDVQSVGPVLSETELEAALVSSSETAQKKTDEWSKLGI